MAATRRAPPLEIYQDPIPSYDYDFSAPTVEDSLYPPLAPLAMASNKQNTKLNPSNISFGGLSPTKNPGQSSSPSAETLSLANFNAVVIPQPQQYQFQSDSLVKKQLPPFSLSKSASKLAKTALTPFIPIKPQFDQENVYNPPGYSQKTQTEYSSIYGTKAPLKRTLMEAAPLTEKSANKKHKKTESVPAAKPQVTTFSAKAPTLSPREIADPFRLSMPEDDGTKPPLSYAQLIGMAILRSPNHRLTLAQIYKWISDNYSFYRQAESGWQNSIRHNLSLNKAFDKQERPKDDPGKGNYWIIKPGSEAQFLKDKPRRNTASDGATSIANSSDPVRPSTAPSNSFRNPVISSNIDSSRFPDEAELSSDATIPASDTAHEGIDADQNDPVHPQVIYSSPPPANIHSSPPPGLSQAIHREATPPPIPGFPGNSRSGGRKRKFAAAGLGDSGYYSSIESSVIRGRAPVLTSEADVEPPAKRRGRAEEEIARIRSSSFGSPTNIGFGYNHMMSSPFRPFQSQVPQGTRTPPTVFKKPARPVASISPNTNLRNHRNNVKKLLGSPLKDTTPVPSLAPFTLDPTGTPSYGLFLDENSPFPLSPENSPSYGSTERATKRPRLERASTTTGLLADLLADSADEADDFIPSPYRVPKVKYPIKKMPFGERFSLIPSYGRIWPSPVKKSAPSPAPTSMPTVSQDIPSIQAPPEEDFLFGVEFPSDGSEPGFDITQGFQKIGDATKIGPGSFASLAPPLSWSNNASPTKKAKHPTNNNTSTRPALGRSATTLF